MSDGTPPLHEKILSTREIYRGRVVHLLVHDIETGDGTRSRREVIRHNGAVAMVPLTPQREVILVRQYRIAAGQVLLEIPAGTLEDGEDPLACAQRELQEEIKHRAGNIEKLGETFLAPGYSSEVMHLFLCSDLQPAAADSDHDENLEIDRVPFDELLAVIDRGEIKDAKTVTGVLWAGRRMGWL